MKNQMNVIRSNPIRTMLLLAVAALSMAFTIPGCPNVDELNTKISTLEKKVDAQQKTIGDLSNQVRTMNDEHNTMKSLVSQISSSVLEQKDALEKIDAHVKEMGSRKAAPAAKAPAAKSKKRR